MYRLFLATRYLWSRPISWVSMVGIWLSVMALVTTISIMSGFLRETRTAIRGTMADIMVTVLADEYTGEVLQPPPSFAQVNDALAGLPGIQSIAPHLVRFALIRAEKRPVYLAGSSRFRERSFTQVIGVNPQLESKATDFALHIRRPSKDKGIPLDDPERPFWIEHVPARLRNQELPIVLVGESLASFFGLQKGEVITLATMPEELKGDEVKALTQRFIVGGTVLSGNYQTDSQTVWIDIAAAQRFAESKGDSSEICVQATPSTDLDELRAAIIARLEHAKLRATVDTWKYLNRTMLSAVENERSILGFILAFFVLITCCNVFATITIMVTDKTRDIGVLAAMGATGKGILQLFVGSGLVMTLVGATVGVVTGVVLAANINLLNDGIEDIFGVRIFRADVYLFDKIPVQIEPLFVAAVYVGTILFAGLCALIPAARAARMDPVRALRHD